MRPQISIVLPVKNASKFIGECIESILSQTFIDFEVVVVDDGHFLTKQKKPRRALYYFRK